MLLEVVSGSLECMLRVTSGSLYIGDEKETGIFIEDIQENKELYQRVIHLSNELNNTMRELIDTTTDIIMKDDLKTVIDIPKANPQRQLCTRKSTLSDIIRLKELKGA